MRCILCENISWKMICKKCTDIYLKPVLKKREIDNEFFVNSFYAYEDIKDLINAKYEFYGDKIFSILSKLTFEKFAQNFSMDENIIALPIDDHTRNHFSHSAILAKYLKSKNIKPIFNTLRARSIVKYAGKDLKFRKNNPRNFSYKGKNNLKIILVDDLVTTGSTILEAKKVLELYGCEVLFALTLSDARV